MNGIHVIFGSSGTVGTALLHELHAAGESARGIFCSRTPTGPAVDRARVDLSTGEGLDAAMRDARTVFLATGDMQDQVAAELRVVEAATKARVARVVKLSIMSADSEAFFYARIHRAVERALESSGLAHTHLRPGGFMQNFVTYYGQEIKLSGGMTIPCEDFEENLIDARDIARVAARCLLVDEFAGRALTLCGPRPVRYSAILDSIGAATGRALELRANAPEAFRAAMLPWATSAEHVDGIIDMLRFHVEGNGPKTSGAFREVVGAEPRSIEAFVEEHAAAWRA